VLLNCSLSVTKQSSLPLSLHPTFSLSFCHLPHPAYPNIHSLSFSLSLSLSLSFSLSLINLRPSLPPFLSLSLSFSPLSPSTTHPAYPNCSTYISAHSFSFPALTSLIPSFTLSLTSPSTKRINSSREVAPGNAVVASAQRWRPQVNGRKNNNKSKLLGRAEFTSRPGA
jgi:hypothetical protein